MQRIILPFLLLLIIASSCNKRVVEVRTETSPIQSYSLLDSGSYWVYERFLRDGSGYYTPTGVYDSCYVAKDTVARGERWAKYMDPYRAPGYTLLRDSLWFIVDYSGKILFATGDTTTLFSRDAVPDPGHVLSDADTFAVVEHRGAGRAFATVPAGVFDTKGFRDIYTITLPAPGMPKVRTLYTRYSVFAGKVSEDLSFQAASAETLERRLIRFRVRPIAVE